MAIDWKVTFKQKENGHFSALFERFDTVAPEAILERITIKDAILETKEQKDKLWAQVKIEQTKQAEINSTIATLETAGKNALMAKE